MEVIKSLCDATHTKFGSGLIETTPKVKKGKFKSFAEWEVKCQTAQEVSKVNKTFLKQQQWHQ